MKEGDENGTEEVWRDEERAGSDGSALALWRVGGRGDRVLSPESALLARAAGGAPKMLDGRAWPLRQEGSREGPLRGEVVPVLPLSAVSCERSCCAVKGAPAGVEVK